MEYLHFEKRVQQFLSDKGWVKVIEGNSAYFIKNYNSSAQFTNNRYLLSDQPLYDKLVKIFKGYNLETENISDLINRFNDTDFIVAGLQVINEYIYGKKPIEKRTIGLFQPVIRLKQLDKCGSEEGYLSSFVNICTIDIDTNIDKYLHRLDQWISILSMLSLHSSGLKLALKNKTTIFDGMGIEFRYKEIDLGQANLYNFKIEGEEKYISDFGFGYERILWLLNGLSNFFTPIYPNYEILYGDNQKNDRIRTATLLVLSDILPSSNGIGSKVRNMICGGCVLSEKGSLIDMIAHYYNYYKKFIEPKNNEQRTIEIINAEAVNNRKKIISRENSINFSPKKSLDDICGEIILQKNRK